MEPARRVLVLTAAEARMQRIRTEVDQGFQSLLSDVVALFGVILSIGNQLTPTHPALADEEVDVVACIDRMAVLVQANDVFQQRSADVLPDATDPCGPDALGATVSRVVNCAELLADVEVSLLDAAGELDLALSVLESRLVSIGAEGASAARGLREKSLAIPGALMVTLNSACADLRLLAEELDHLAGQQPRSEAAPSRFEQHANRVEFFEAPA